ncbi:hemogen [Cariama cristata]
MANSGKDCASSDSSLPSSAAHEEYAVPEVLITHRLRDREMLRKRKAEAQEKDSVHWVMREQKRKWQRRGRGSRRGRGRQALLQHSPEQELEPDPQQEAEPEPVELASPEPVQQEELPVLTIQDLVNEIQPGVAELAELVGSSQDPTGEEEVLRPMETEIPEAVNIHSPGK